MSRGLGNPSDSHMDQVHVVGQEARWFESILALVG